MGKEMVKVASATHCNCGAKRPGVLAQLAGLVSQYGGNILRSVNNTLPDGGFDLRLVIHHLSCEQEAHRTPALPRAGFAVLRSGQNLTLSDNE